jgi:hypothetical protein
VDRARVWLYNTLIPERIAGAAVAEFFTARGLKATCNRMQAVKNSEISMAKIWLPAGPDRWNTLLPTLNCSF